MTPKLTRRKFIAGVAAFSAFAPKISSVKAHENIAMNDASKLSPVSVFSHWTAQNLPETTFIENLRKELKQAAASKRPVCVGAARHSMGGQSLAQNGCAMTFDINHCELDRANKTYKVHGGTRWFEVIKHLDKIGFSPSVMQSNSDFGVAATFSVNAHGWAAPSAPFGSTVRSIRLMLADGELVTCSRTQNAELFGLAMGGYGLFGIIIDLEVEMVDNLLLKPHYQALPATEFAAQFIKTIELDASVRMIYGRMNVARADFMTEALIVSYRPEPTPNEGLPVAVQTTQLSQTTRDVYRSQIGSEPAKLARWSIEKYSGNFAASITRNTLLNEPVANLAGNEPHRTDILHEYFIAPQHLNAFIEGCQKIIPKASAEFLNITLRYVLQDDVSVLSYAKTNRISAVMSFSQAMTAEGEADMRQLTEALIDLAAANGGSFYLPYRLHARVEQVARIYPNSNHFIERKAYYDRGYVFRNTMWDMYFRG
jgi:FAD/FMN-containing dehydrogenase